jgi:hypothetical protein
MSMAGNGKARPAVRSRGRGDVRSIDLWSDNERIAVGGRYGKSGMFKALVVPLVFASFTAATLAQVTDRRGFEELAIRAAVAEEARGPNSKCPVSPEYTDTAEISLLSICLRYGLGAYQAARRYPESAAKVFAVYGEDETFQKVLDHLGHPVIPVVAYFVEHGSRELQLRQAAGEAAHEIWEGKRPKWHLADITREQIGLIAIYQLERRGHEMLAEFEIVDGKAIRKPTRRLLFGLKDLLLGGVDDVETILVRGERLPTWKEVGFAALDVAVIAGGVGAIAKAARFGIGAAEAVEKNAVRVAAENAAEESSVRLAAEGAAGNNAIRVVAEGAYKTIAAVGRTGVIVAPVAFTYLAITRPQLVASAGGWVAEQLGGNRIIGIFAVYLIGVFLVLQFLRPLLWCGQAVGKPILGLARYAYTKAAA